MSHSETLPPRLDPRLPPHPLGPFVRGRGGRPRKPGGPPSCRGGSAMVTPHGYVVEYSPDHPRRNGQTVLQHRLVMECMLGRLLEPNEVVHHRNGDRTDNRADNLQVLDQRSHGLEHAEESRALQQAPLRRGQVRRALRGRSTKEAAAALGVHHQTLRNRFEDLLQKRRGPGGEFPAEFVERARALAADPKVGTRLASRTLDVAEATLRACCRIHEILWTSAPMGRPSRSKSAAGVTR